VRSAVVGEMGHGASRLGLGFRRNQRSGAG
jgi:hypothetical protein